MDALLNPSVSAISLPVQLVGLTQDYLAGSKLEALALKYNMQVDEVSEFLNRKEVKRYIATELKSYKLLNVQKRIDILSAIVDEKLEFAVDNDLPTSNKDIVEVLKLLREESRDIQVAEVEDNSGKAQYVQIINQLKVD